MQNVCFDKNSKVDFYARGSVFFKPRLLAEYVARKRDIVHLPQQGTPEHQSSKMTEHQSSKMTEQYERDQEKHELWGQTTLIRLMLRRVLRQSRSHLVNTRLDKIS